MTHKKTNYVQFYKSAESDSSLRSSVMVGEWQQSEVMSELSQPIHSYTIVAVYSLL